MASLHVAYLTDVYGIDGEFSQLLGPCPFLCLSHSLALPMAGSSLSGLSASITPKASPDFLCQAAYPRLFIPFWRGSACILIYLLSPVSCTREKQDEARLGSSLVDLGYFGVLGTGMEHCVLRE